MPGAAIDERDERGQSGVDVGLEVAGHGGCSNGGQRGVENDSRRGDERGSRRICQRRT